MQFGAQRQFKSGDKPKTPRSPFVTAMESAARLREATALVPPPVGGLMRNPNDGYPKQQLQPIDVRPPQSPIEPPVGVRDPLQFRSAASQSAPAVEQVAPQFLSGQTAAKPPMSAPPQFRTAGGAQEFSHYDANGNPVYLQAQSAPTPQNTVPPPQSPNVAVEERTRAVTPGDPGRAEYYASTAAKLNTTPSRWYGNITADDVRAFDAYSVSYTKRTGKPAPQVWDWLAAGRPQTTGDYYDDKAVEYNGYDTPYKGQINRDDVVNFHAFAKSRESAGLPSMHITEWLERGKPMKGPTAGMPRGGSGVYVPPGGWPRGSTYGQPSPPSGGVPLPPAVTAPPPPTPTPGSQGAPLPPGGPQVPGLEPPVTPQSGGPQLEDFNDSLSKTIAEISSRYKPGFDRANDDLQQRLMQTGAITGAVNAGGFTDVVGDALIGQGAEQSKELGAEISKQVINSQQLAMTKYVAELDDAFKSLQLRTNADLEAKAQELQKYGIDKGDLLERYKSELALKGVTYSADRQVDAAAMQAAASSAAAASNAAAAKYNADRDYALGLVNADVTREGNIWAGLVQLGLGSADWMKWFLASDPLGVITGNTPPGDVVVKP